MTNAEGVPSPFRKKWSGDPLPKRCNRLFMVPFEKRHWIRRPGLDRARHYDAIEDEALVFYTSELFFLGDHLHTGESGGGGIAHRAP
jgi:hypothetical protein